MNLIQQRLGTRRRVAGCGHIAAAPEAVAIFADRCEQVITERRRQGPFVTGGRLDLINRLARAFDFRQLAIQCVMFRPESGQLRL